MKHHRKTEPQSANPGLAVGGGRNLRKRTNTNLWAKTRPSQATGNGCRLYQPQRRHSNGHPKTPRRRPQQAKVTMPKLWIRATTTTCNRPRRWGWMRTHWRRHTQRAEALEPMGEEQQQSGRQFNMTYTAPFYNPQYKKRWPQGYVRHFAPWIVSLCNWKKIMYVVAISSHYIVLKCNNSIFLLHCCI